MNHPMQRSLTVRSGLVCPLAFGAILILFGAAPVAIAQAPPAAAGGSGTSAVDELGYKVLVPINSLATNKVNEAKARNRIRSIISSPENELQDDLTRNYFDSYYVRFFFPMLTQTTPEALSEMPDRRNAFFRNELEYCSNAEEHAHLVGLALDQMSAIVQDGFHPAVRYNAMLLISCLNDQEVVRIGTPKRVPEPMARALPFILDQFRKPDNSDAIKVAALVGLSRHLEWDPHRLDPATAIPAPLRAEIINELLTLAQAKDPPEGRNAEGHLWFRRRAVEALGFACFQKTDPAVAAALDKLLKDESEPLSLRLSVAAAMGRMNYQVPATVDTLATVKELGYLALLACDSELNRVTKLAETESERAARIRGEARTVGYGGGGDSEGFSDPGMDAMDSTMPDGAGGMYGPDSGFGGGTTGNLTLQDPKAYRFDFVRRKIRYDLYCVQLGITGGDDFDPSKRTQAPAAAPGNIDAKLPSRGINAFAKPGPEKQFVTEVYGLIRKLAETVESKAVDMATLEKDLRRDMKALEAITKKIAPPAAPAGTPVPSDVPRAVPGDVPAPPVAPAAPAAAPEAPAATPAVAP